MKKHFRMNNYSGSCRNCEMRRVCEGFGALPFTDAEADEAVMEKFRALFDSLLVYGELRNHYPDARIVIMLGPSRELELMTAESSEAILSALGDYSEVDVVGEAELLLRYDPAEVIEVGGDRYLAGTAEIFEIDENGNECSIDPETMYDVLNFVEKNLTEIVMDGDAFPILRLE